MAASHVAVTSRLTLREWRSDDRAAFALLNADPEVMQHFPSTLTRQESDALVDRFEADLAKRGFAMWAVEERTTGSFIGFTGLSVPSFDAPFMPAVEVGWRFARSAWGHGYATEAGRAALRFGFEQLHLHSVVSFTTVGNVRSRRVMERLGMSRDPAEDFDHPGIPEGDPLRRHVLYRLNAASWRPNARDTAT